MLFAAAISKFASLTAGLLTSAIDDPRFLAIAAQDSKDGQHRSDRPQYFTTSYFPRELGEEIVDAGFSRVTVAAVEGPVWVAPDFQERWSDPERRSVLLELARSVESEPSLMGMSAHLLATAHR